MIVKIHSRGKGAGKGPVQYLLGKDGQREDARLDRGNPSEVIDLIDGLKFAQKYTSGVLSFAEKDLPEQLKQQIMDAFQEALFPGLDKDQYSVLWVQHLDKNRLELNFVVPNVELLSGKRLQPYYDRADRVRVNAFKVACNAKYKLADPDDPLRRRALTTPNDLPPKIAEAQELITDGLLSLASSGQIKNREDIINTLENKGFSIARVTKNSISIKNPSGEPNASNIRLKGALYAQNFSYGPSLQREIEEAGERYQGRIRERLSEAVKTYRSATEVKREYHCKRFKRPQTDDIAVEQNNISTPSGVDPRRSIDDGDYVSIPKPMGNRKSRAGELGKVPRVQPKSDTLQDSGVGDDRARERAVEGCRGISRGAEERARENESAAESYRTDARVRPTSEQADRSIGKLREYTDRAIRAIGGLVEKVKSVSRKEVGRSKEKPSDSGPSMNMR